MKIKILRQKSILDIFRSYKIYIDNKQVANLSATSVDFEVNEIDSNNELYVKVDFCSSNKLALNKNKKSQTFLVSNNLINQYLILLSIIVVCLDNYFNQLVLKVCVIMLFIVFILRIIWYNKNYLELSEID